MKKFKQLFFALLMCCVLIIPMTACNEQGIIRRYVDETYLVRIYFKEDATLKDTYYALLLMKSDLETYKCKNHKALLSNEDYLSTVHTEKDVLNETETDYIYKYSDMEICPVLQEEWKKRIDVFIYGIEGQFSFDVAYILLYESNQVIDRKTDLLNYVALIDLP